MSTNPPLGFSALPTISTNQPRALASQYIAVFSSLFSSLPEYRSERASLSSNFYMEMLTYLPTTLPPLFTTKPPDNPALAPSFHTRFSELISKLNILHSVLITITCYNHLSVSVFFTNISPIFYSTVNILHHSLYNDNTPTRLDSLQTTPTPSNDFLPVLSSEQTNMLMNWLLALLSDLSTLITSLINAIDILPHKLRFGLFSDHKRLLENLMFDINFLLITMRQTWFKSGVRKQDLEKLTVKYVYQANRDAETDNDNCAICLEEMKNGDRVRRLYCFHAFHMDCIDPWLEKTRNCPLCRKDVTTETKIVVA